MSRTSPLGTAPLAARPRTGLRVATGSLTTRGRAFLSSGVTALVCAVLLGLDDLARVGALLVLLPAVAALVITRGRHRLGLARTVEPGQVTAGQTAYVDLELSNEGKVPTGLLLLEEQVPYALGVRPRFVIDRMGPRWRRSIRYEVRSEVRGRFALGPMTVRVNDPFGLAAFTRSFHSSSSVVVTPRVVALPPIPLAGSWSGSGEHRPRAFAGGSAEDVTTREYRRGDDLRRVHWRSSAHAGELMVRREEQPWQSRATLFVDNRSWVHRGAGPASSLEYAVALAASVGVHLSQRGFEVRLLTADGPVGSGAHAAEGVVTDRGGLLESLAVLTESNRVKLSSQWLDGLAHGGLLVGIFGAVAGDELDVLGRIRQPADVPLGFFLDVEQWAAAAAGTGAGVAAGSPAGSAAGRPVGRPAGRLIGHPAGAVDADAAAALFAARGWRTTTVGPADALPVVWQRLASVQRRVPLADIGEPPHVDVRPLRPVSSTS